MLSALSGLSCWGKGWYLPPNSTSLSALRYNQEQYPCCKGDFLSKVPNRLSGIPANLPCLEVFQMHSCWVHCVVLVYWGQCPWSPFPAGFWHPAQHRAAALWNGDGVLALGAVQPNRQQNLQQVTTIFLTCKAGREGGKNPTRDIPCLIILHTSTAIETLWFPCLRFSCNIPFVPSRYVKSPWCSGSFKDLHFVFPCSFSDDVHKTEL